jgi:hypothetical protein
LALVVIWAATQRRHRVTAVAVALTALTLLLARVQIMATTSAGMWQVLIWLIWPIWPIGSLALLLVGSRRGGGLSQEAHTWRGWTYFVILPLTVVNAVLATLEKQWQFYPGATIAVSVLLTGLLYRQLQQRSPRGHCGR